MLPNFAVLPPEVNSARVFAGAGSAPMLAAAAAWDDLASELHCAAMSFGSVTSGLVVGWWQGSASAAMVDAAASYIGWLSTSAAHAEGAAGLARAAVSVFEEALAATVHPAMVAANRAQVASLVASNLFGQNAPAIAALESLYEWMWAQDAAAMAGYYVGASAVATQLASWLQRLQSIPGAASLDARLPSSAEAPMGVVRAVNSAIAANAAAAQTVGLVMGGSGTPIPSARYVELANALYMSGSVPGVIAQALFTPQGLYPVVVIKNLTFDSSVAQGAVILESAIRQQIAAGNNVTVFGYSQSATISSLVMANLAASADPPSPDELSFTLIGNPNNPNGGVATRFPGNTIAPFLGLLGGVAAADAAGDVLGEATSGGLGGALVAPLGSAGGLGGTVAAGLGNAATVGTLSVPPSWTAAAPLASPLGSALGGTPMVAPPPAVAAGMPGMPFGTMGGQGFGRAVPQYGFRPNFVARPPAAG